MKKDTHMGVFFHMGAGRTRTRDNPVMRTSLILKFRFSCEIL